MLHLIRHYTHEAGVRNLEREIQNISRKMARRVVTEGPETTIEISPTNVKDYLGVLKFREMWLEKHNEIGLATGLAWTEVGGSVLAVEATIMEGKGRLTPTGKLGEVMQESAQAAMSYVRSRTEQFGLQQDFYRSLDIHVHVPEGAIPKDGPSAGITICTSIVSAHHAHRHPLRRGHDRRDHLARQGAANRRRQREAAGGPPNGLAYHHPSEG